MAAGKVLYIDPWTGVAGDMLLAALDTEKDGQALQEVLRQSVAALGLDPEIVTVTRADEAGVSALGLQVNEEGQPDFTTSTTFWRFWRTATWRPESRSAPRRPFVGWPRPRLKFMGQLPTTFTSMRWGRWILWSMSWELSR